MIKFEMHDNQLFRMLEEPVPLTTDAKLPCLVRLIQDDSPMGRNNKNSFASCLEQKYVIKELVGNKNIWIENGLIITHCSRFEIIGYPVADGSAEWALYQMMQGETVTFLDYPNRTLKLVNGYIQDSISDGFWNRKPGNDFLSYASSTGWQLYKEPKPEPAKEPIAGCDNCKHRCTKSNIDYCQMYEPKPEPAKEQFEVGDWLEFIDAGGRKSQGKYLSNIYHNEILVLDITCNLRVVVPTTKIIRKLSHSEVVVPITISGIVRQAYNEDGTIDDEQFQLLPNGSWDGTEVFISFDALDSHTRKLVESLLKAQEEEK